MNTLAARKGGPIVRLATMPTEALRGITARQLRVTLVLGGAWALIMMLLEWKWNYGLRGWRGLAIDFVDFELGALWLLLAVAVADAAIAHGAPRRTAYVVAALAGCVVFDLFSFTVIGWLGSAILGPTPVALPNREWSTPVIARIYRFTHSLLFVGSAVFLYAQWRAAHRMQEHLRAAELDRVRKSRIALESRLQALQARVEPEFLFRTLSQVRDLCDGEVVVASVARASGILDELIAYLRAATPHMRHTSSTVAQEIELARAYLDIARLRLDGHLGVDIVVDDGAADARMPPMVLVPLIDDALAACGGDRCARPAIRVDVLANGDRLQVSVTRAPDRLPSADATALANIRERLSALYGADASLEITQSTVGSVETRLDIPFEVAPQMTSEETDTTFPRG
jgi:hypothetical protein